MQINTIGFPAGLFGAPGATPDAGAGFAQTLGMALGVPTNTAGPALTPPPAANDSVAPKTPLTMAQLLASAAPQAPETLVTTQAATLPVAETPVEMPIEAPVAEMLPQDPAAALPAEPGKPSAPAGPADPKPAPAAEPAAEALAEMLAEPAEAPAPQAAEEQPAEAPKDSAPPKRGPRLATTGEEATPADPATIPADAPAIDMVAVAVVQQAPVKPELAVKPQPSPSRQMSDVAPAARKADAGRAEPAAAEPRAPDAKANAAVAAVTGKQGGKNDNAAPDDRGQAAAFTLRHDAHAASAHAAAEPARTPAAPAVAAAEPVVAARPGHLGQQIGVEIARKIESGEDTLRVRLSPDNLGKVEVTLAFDDGGTLRATVRAESQHALDLLRQDAPDLGRALDQAGIRADAQSFRFESRGEGGTAQGQQQQQNQPQAGKQLAGNDEPDTTEAAYRSIRSDGQVDLLA